MESTQPAEAALGLTQMPGLTCHPVSAFQDGRADRPG